MKRYYYILLFFLTPLISSGQVSLIIEGMEYFNTQSTWGGVDIERTVPTLLTFRMNSISSLNTAGYMLQSGDDSYLATAGNLDNALISGNYFDWNGTPGATLCHGIMAGYNINYDIRHNYIDGPYYGVVHEGGYDDGSSMVNTEGGIRYNIFKNSPTPIIILGYENPMVYNNTFYYGLSSNTNGLIRISSSNGTEVPAPSRNVKIKNNIFYVVNSVTVISLAEESTEGFESDYNIYYCEQCVDNEPVFKIADNTVTWDEWQALGYDTHSLVIDPGFIDYTDFVPLSRLDYGIDMGADYDLGLSISASWNPGQYPSTVRQNGSWQVGAILFDEDADPVPVYLRSVIENNTPDILEMTYSLSMSTNPPPSSAFTVYVNSVRSIVNSVEVSGTKVFLSLAGGVEYGDRVRVTYTIPQTNPLQTPDGRLAASITDRPVTNNCVPLPNQPPVISISSPRDNSSFEAPAVITFTADALDSDGTVEKVEYFIDEDKIGESFTYPYNLSFDFQYSGTFEITAIATDDENAATKSDPVKIFIVPGEDLSELVQLFPNPNDGRFSVELPYSPTGEVTRLAIVDLEGKPVFEELLALEETQRDFDLSALKSGIYVLLVSTDKEIITTKLFIKK